MTTTHADTERDKERARDWWREGALHYDWWECAYEDAAEIGLKITGFDTGRGCDIEGHFTDTPERVAEKIIAGHGEHTGTAAEARAYQRRWPSLWPVPSSVNSYSSAQ